MPGVTRALIIGVNYEDEKDIKGVSSAEQCLSTLKELGFAAEQGGNLRMLIQKEDAAEANLPGKTQIQQGMTWLGTDAKAGDVLWLHFSGAGSINKHEKGDGSDECILPLDHKRKGVITDDEMFDLLVGKLPGGVTLYAVFDCCHSGSVIDISYTFKKEKNKFEDNPEYAPTECDVFQFTSVANGKEAFAAGLDEASARLQAIGGLSNALYPIIKEGQTWNKLYKNLFKALKKQATPMEPFFESGKDANPMRTAFQNAFPALLKENEEAVAWESKTDEEKKMEAMDLPESKFNSAITRALVIGINYKGTKAELKGCINDTETCLTTLASLGFKPELEVNTRLLTEEGETRHPTKREIQDGMKWLVKDAKKGDVFWFHYSGHGGQTKDKDGDEDDGMDEALVPLDFARKGVIADDDIFDMMVAPLPEGATLYVIFDCCHSGTILDVSFHYDSEKNKFIDDPDYAPTDAHVYMITGCMDNQTSADLPPGFDKDAAKAEAVGALSNNLYPMIKEGKNWQTFIGDLRGQMSKAKLSQIPQLETGHAANPFRNAFHSAFPDAIKEDPDAVAKENMTGDEKKMEAMNLPDSDFKSAITRALVIGINYKGTKAELKGCINDTHTCLTTLASLGFKPELEVNTRLLTEEGETRHPTKREIQDGMKWLVKDAKKGDVFWFHYSGHGGQTKDKDGDEDDGMDEALVPLDFARKGVIADDDIFDMMVAPLPEGATLYVIFDCCHSGTILDVSFHYDSEKNKFIDDPDYAPTDSHVYMITGCMDNQTSADLPPGFDKEAAKAEAVGALSNNLYPMIKEGKNWQTFIGDLRAQMSKAKLSQIPQLETGHAANPFRNAFHSAFPTAIKEDPDAVAKENMTGDEKKMEAMNLPDSDFKSAITRALVIGINYKGTKAELKGCINDTHTCLTTLASLGFKPELEVNTRLLTEEGETRHPTKREIQDGMKWLVKDAKKGDVFWFHYSGHGGQTKDKDGDEDDGMDEALVPLDFARKGVIADDDIFDMMVAPLPEGATLYVIFDCCHSGTILDVSFHYDSEKNKFIDDPDYAPTDSHVYMITGCMDNQTSADLPPGFDKDAAKAEAVGALSNNLYPMIKEGKNWQTFIGDLRAQMSKAKLSQIPQLETGHAANPFRNAFHSAFPDAIKEDPDAVAEENKTPDEKKFESLKLPDSEHTSAITRALFVGISYKDTEDELKSSVHDTEIGIRALAKLGFKAKLEHNLRVLTEEGMTRQPTKSQIIDSMNWLVADAKEGDVFWFHYSGLGGLQEDYDGDEDDGFDEALMPLDYKRKGMIADDDIFNYLVAPLPKGAHLYVVFDCCHSGTILDVAYHYDSAKNAFIKDPDYAPTKGSVYLVTGCAADEVTNEEQLSARKTKGEETPRHPAVSTAVGALSHHLYPMIEDNLSWQDFHTRLTLGLSGGAFKQDPQLEAGHRDCNPQETAFASAFPTALKTTPVSKDQVPVRKRKRSVIANDSTASTTAGGGGQKVDKYGVPLKQSSSGATSTRAVQIEEKKRRQSLSTASNVLKAYPAINAGVNSILNKASGNERYQFVFADWSKVLTSVKSTDDPTVTLRRLYVRACHLMKYIDNDPTTRQIVADLQASLLKEPKLSKTLVQLRRKNPGWWESLENPRIITVPEKRIKSPKKNGSK